jgi:cobalt-zinc-cadmium efflux system protein
VPEIVDAHHIHAWSITGEQHLVTLHVLPREGVSAREAVVAVRRRLEQRFQVAHATVQVEDGACLDEPGHDDSPAG